MGGRLAEVIELVAGMPIVDVLSEMYALSFQPHNDVLIGQCPMHEDFPSTLVIDQINNTYSCEECGHDGDAVKYVSRYEGVDEIEALAKICDVHRVLYSDERYDKEQRERLFTIYDVHEHATAFYQKQLYTEQAAWALEYLKGRMSEESIEKFRIGYASYGGVYAYLRFDIGIPLEALLESQLVLPKKDKPGHRDFFLNRIIFPVIDVNYRPIAFVGRAEEGSDFKKYINSRQSPIFEKSETLYGIQFAQPIIRRFKKALVIEGPTDVIANHENGIEYAVGTVGTAFTKHHIDSLAKKAKNIIIGMDDDDAGRKAALRAGGVALEQGVNLGFLKLDNQDPDEAIKDDLGDYLNRLTNPLSLVEFAFLNSDIMDIDDPDRRYHVVTDDMFALIDKQRNHVQKVLWLKHLADKLDLDPQWFYNGYRQHLQGTRREGRPIEDYVIAYAAANPLERRRMGTIIRPDHFSSQHKGWLWRYFTQGSITDGAMIRSEHHTNWGPMFPNGHENVMPDFKRFCDENGLIIHDDQISDLEGILIRADRNPRFSDVVQMQMEVLQKEMQSLEWEIKRGGSQSIDDLTRRYNAKYDVWAELKGGNHR